MYFEKMSRFSFTSTSSSCSSVQNRHTLTRTPLAVLWLPYTRKCDVNLKFSSFCTALVSIGAALRTCDLRSLHLLEAADATEARYG